MLPIRRGRGRGQFEESAGQNEDRRSARSHTRVSDEEEVEVAAPPVERMDFVIARFQRMNPPVFNDCGSLRQSGPRPDPRLLRQAALEALKRSARTNTPRKNYAGTISGEVGGDGGGDGGGAWGGGGGGVRVRRVAGFLLRV
ncbi:hypothetical protein F511_36451 [Dorcoceras hygrometricum]|uniref:Uncharacterized protein n=1 Tax=Dorcoceras hygrometricum TaxID=472368 RepID=A0A2Z7BGH0_9LAMI|nr:hypothetical protein F511_36451 [Dorcoceras hygrometricum]